MTMATNIAARDLKPFEIERVEATRRKIYYWPSLFIVLLAVPFIIDIGSLRLTPYRFFLVVIFFPAIIGWFFGAAGKKRMSDYLFIFYAIWCCIALVGADGFNVSIEPAGMLVVETLGSYFLARTFIRTKYQFVAMVKTYLYVLFILLPFAILEALTFRTVLLDILDKFGKVLPGTFLDRAGRMGLRRAQVSFEHPILYGLFTSYGFGLIAYGLEKKQFRVASGFRALISPVCTFFSLSTGAFLAVGTQGLLAGWEYISRGKKNRWWFLFGLFALAYITIDALSNRSPFAVFVSYMTFDSSTSFNRFLIWEYGTAQVWRTPVFGIGLTGDWERPWWVNPSMDNFWLLLAVRHGVLAIVFFLGAVFFAMRDIIKADLKSQELQNIRLAIIIPLVSIFVAICSVHLWNATYALFMFMLGCGIWLADTREEDGAPTPVQSGGNEKAPKKTGNFRPAVRPAAGSAPARARQM